MSNKVLNSDSICILKQIKNCYYYLIMNTIYKCYKISALVFGTRVKYVSHEKRGDDVMFAAHTVSNRIARCVNEIANRILKKQKKTYPAKKRSNDLVRE